MASTELRLNVVYCLISTLLVTGEYDVVFYRGTDVLYLIS